MIDLRFIKEERRFQIIQNLTNDISKSLKTVKMHDCCSIQSFLPWEALTPRFTWDSMCENKYQSGYNTAAKVIGKISADE